MWRISSSTIASTFADHNYLHINAYYFSRYYICFSSLHENGDTYTFFFHYVKKCITECLLQNGSTGSDGAENLSPMVPSSRSVWNIRRNWTSNVTRAPTAKTFQQDTEFISVFPLFPSHIFMGSEPILNLFIWRHVYVKNSHFFCECPGPLFWS